MTRLKTVFIATALMFSATVVVWAQVQNGAQFDPATRAIRGLTASPTDATGTTPAAANDPNAPTPEQIAEQQRQQKLAEMAARKAEARKKAEAAEKARHEKMLAMKTAEEKHIKEQKAKHEADMKRRKDAREQLKSLQKEEVTARKAYKDSLKDAKGSARTDVEDQYRKAEQDRRKKMSELRHPKHNADGSTATSSSSSGSGGSTANPSSTPGSLGH